MGNFDTLQKTILYVDDQPSHRALFKRAFQGKYEIVTAASGEEGLEIIQKNKIALVIADHNMPGMTGIDFLEKVQEMDPKAEKAILSAYLDDGILKDVNRRIKVTGRLAKPWKLEGMRGFIEKAFLSFASTMSSSLSSSMAEEGDVADVPLLAQAAESPSESREDPSNEIAGDKPVLSSRQLAQAVDQLATETVDPRGARRIFLHFVEPRIKSIFPLIKKPCAPLLKQAQGEALKGNVDALEKTLRQYLGGDALAQILSEIADPSKKILH